jgi:cystathionine beta-lyase
LTTAFDFDLVIDRKSSGSNKWNFYPDDVLPMWVADMDFRAPPAIIKALQAKIEHGIFGYELPSESLLNLICEHLDRLYGWKVTPKSIVALPGLVTGLNAVCRAICKPGDGLLIQTPIYPPFLEASRNHQLAREIAPLTYVSSGRTIEYELDYDVFEASVTEHTRLFILCNPHNPIGQVYSPEQLDRLAEICLRHNVVICSDEIHAELLLGGASHTPLASRSPEIADRTITLISPSKTFNVPGLFCSFAIVTNPGLSHALVTAANGIVPHPNILGLAAAEAAYRADSETREWLRQLLGYLTDNRDLLVEYVSKRLPGVKTTCPDATYLAWLDCRETGLEDPYEFFLTHAKVGFNDGVTFGEDGAGFVRLNFGCARGTLLEGLNRVEQALNHRQS